MNYVIFLIVILFIKWKLDSQTRQNKKKKVLPGGIIKQTYTYQEPDPNKKRGIMPHNRHECNIYSMQDADTEKQPLIIDIHGGCWISGNKDAYNSYNSELVKKGNVVSSLTYRTADHAKLADQIRDVFAYLHFLKDHAEELKLNMKDVMLTGDSAGAELSLIAHCINQSEEMQRIFKVEPVDLDFSCMVLTHPVCFIDQAGKIANSEFLSKYFAIPGMQRMLYGKHYLESEEYHYSVNPARFLKPEMKFPPILLVTSEGDENFRYQTFLLAELFDTLDIDYRIYYEKNEKAQHVFNINSPFSKAAEKCNTFINDFFHMTIFNDHMHLN